MRLPRFEYREPKNVEEAKDLLSQYGDKAKLLAGGTELLVKMKQRLLTPQSVININNLAELKYIKYDPAEGLRIGPLTTHQDLEDSPVIKQHYSIIGDAASRLGTPQLRAMGTVGGNICLDSMCWYYNQSHFWRKSRVPCYKREGDRCYVVKGSTRCYALFLAEAVSPLIALGAKVRLEKKGGDRVLPLEEFYTSKGEYANIIKPNELLREIHIGPAAANNGGSYIKFAIRGAIDFAILGAASQITLEGGDGVCKDAHIVVNGVASGPFRAREAEKVLQGKSLTEETIEEAGKAAMQEARPVSHMGIGGDYKRKMVNVFVKRSLRKALENAKR